MRSSGRRRASSRAACSPVRRGIATSSTARSTSSRSAELHRLDAVGRLGDDAQVRLGVEHVAQPAADDRVVVGDQDARDAAGRSSRRAPRAAPRSRRSRRRPTSSRPPTSSARSRMPPRPAPSRPRESPSRGRRRRPRSTSGLRELERDLAPRGRPRGARRWSAPPARRGRRPAPARAPAPAPRRELARAHPDPARSANADGERDSALRSPKSSSASGRSPRVISRTSSTPSRAVSCAARPARPAPRRSSPRPSSCSTTPVSVWPTSSCSSRASRRRSPSWAQRAAAAGRGARARAGRASR